MTYSHFYSVPMNIALPMPLLEKLHDMWVELIKAIPNITLGAIIILLTWALSVFSRRATRAILSRSSLRQSLTDFVLIVVRVSIWTLGLLLAATTVFPSMTPAKLLAGLGIGSIAIGFAFKDILENFLAGVMIMLRSHMRIGDYISCENLEGRVESITIRDTYIRQVDDQLVLIPNSFLYKNPVIVRTDHALRMFSIICGVAYDSDLNQAADVIKQAVSEQELVNKVKPVDVFASEFNSSSVDFTVRWWSESKPIDLYKSRDQVIRAIHQSLADAGIEIPFPYRTLTFKDPLPIKKAQENKAQ